MNIAHWKDFRHRLEALGCRLLAAAIPLLPRRACVRLGDALGNVAFRFDRRGRPVALANLECAFGDRFSPTERREVARGSYRNFVRTMLDLFWAQRLTRENFQEWMHVEGFAELRGRMEREGRGAVFIGVHQGCWEWAGLASGFLGFSHTVVAEGFKNPRLTAVFSAAREHSGQKIIAQGSSLLRMLRVVKNGGTTGMLIDLSLRPSQAATVVRAFGKSKVQGSRFKAAGDGEAAAQALDHRPSTLDSLLMCVPLLHAVLAQRAGALLVPLEYQPLADGTCRITAHPAVEFPEGATLEEIAQRCWDTIEPQVHARPGEWLSPYKHFRYLPQATERAYPFYAHTSGKFEKLLKKQPA